MSEHSKLNQALRVASIKYYQSESLVNTLRLFVYIVGILNLTEFWSWIAVVLGRDSRKGRKREGIMRRRSRQGTIRRRSRDPVPNTYALSNSVITPPQLRSKVLPYIASLLTLVFTLTVASLPWPLLQPSPLPLPPLHLLYHQPQFHHHHKATTATTTTPSITTTTNHHHHHHHTCQLHHCHCWYHYHHIHLHIKPTTCLHACLSACRLEHLFHCIDNKHICKHLS